MLPINGNSQTHETGMTLIELMVGLAIGAISLYFASLTFVDIISFSKDVEGRNDAHQEMRLLRNEVDKLFSVHRTDELNLTALPCGKHFMNYLRRNPSIRNCTNPATDVQTMLDKFPEDASVATTKSDRGVKLVLELKRAGKVRRVEYETFCSSIPPVNHPYRSKLPQWSTTLYNEMKTKGCLPQPTVCTQANLNAGRTFFMLKRTWDDWKDADDFDGTDNPQFLLSGQPNKTECLPKSLFTYDSFTRSCAFRSDVKNIANLAVGVAMCSWVDNLDAPNTLNARIWSLYAKGGKRIRAVSTELTSYLRNDALIEYE